LRRMELRPVALRFVNSVGQYQPEDIDSVRALKKGKIPQY